MTAKTVVVVAAAVAAIAAAFFLFRPRLARLRESQMVVDVRQELAAGSRDRARAGLIEALDLVPGDAEARRMLAQLELDEKRLEPAFLHFQALSELQPGNTQAWLGLSRVRIAADQAEEAEAALSRAIDAGLEDEAAIKQRAQLRYRFGRYHGALIDAERAIRLDPRDAEAWLIAARSALHESGKDEAIVERAVAAGVDRKVFAQLPDEAAPIPRRGAPDRAEGWPGQLGELIRDLLAKIRGKDWGAAKVLALRAGQTWPATLMGPWLEGLVEYQRGEFAAAEKSFREALRRSPRSHRVVTNLIPIWSRQGGALRVGDELSKLAADDPGFVYPLRIAARAYLEGDQPARAEAALRQEFAILADSPVPFRDLAAFDLEIDRASEAIVVCERGLARFPRDSELHLDAARAGVLLGDRARATEGYEAALRERPDDQVAAAELAALLVEDHGQRDRALALVHTLERDAPIEPEVLGAMGVVFLEGANDAARARQFLEPASAAAPADARLHYELAVAFNRMGSASRAVDELRRALAPGRPFRGEAEARRLMRQLTGAESRVRR